jgi:hypothetical protein
MTVTWAVPGPAATPSRPKDFFGRHAGIRLLRAAAAKALLADGGAR